MAWPSVIRSRSQSRRSCSARRTSDAVGGDAGGAAGVQQQEQRQQSVRLRLVGHQLGEYAGEPDRLGAQVKPQQGAGGRRVALVEDQVDDGEDGREAAGKLGFGGHAVGDAGVPDLALGPDDPLGHGRFRHEERPRDLRRLEPAEQPEGQRDLGGLVQRRMAAGEDQLEPVIGHGLLLEAEFRPRRVGAIQVMRLRVPLVTDRLAAQPVDGPVAGSRDDPRARIGRQALRRPPGGRHGERVLDRFLGGVDIAEKADQGSDAAAVLTAEDSLDIHCARAYGRCTDTLTARRTRYPGPSSRSPSNNGRTSIGRCSATAASLAHSRASSRSAALMIQNPARCSLVSVYGPSVIRKSPPDWRTTVADSAPPCMPLLKTNAPASFSLSPS